MLENKELSNKLTEIAKGLKANEVSLAVINLKTQEIAGYNMDHFIYPASIYKVFVAAEVLRQVDTGQRKLEDLVEIKDSNEVDKDNPRFFPSGTHRDRRPLLKAGQKVTVDYLLDLMLTRSDNTAANTLIDLVGREKINENIVITNGWNGSGITRKFLDRSKEDEKYKYSETTLSCGRHLAELFYKIETKNLINEWVSNKLKSYMRRWNRDGRGGLHISEFDNMYGKSGAGLRTVELSDIVGYYRKGGWLEINGYKWNIWRGIKSSYQKGYAVIKYSGDAGVVKGKNSYYSIAVLTITKTKWPWVRFPMKKLSREVYKSMESLNEL